MGGELAVAACIVLAGWGLGSRRTLSVVEPGSHSAAWEHLSESPGRGPCTGLEAPSGAAVVA